MLLACTVALCIFQKNMLSIEPIEILSETAVCMAALSCIDVYKRQHLGWTSASRNWLHSPIIQHQWLRTPPKSTVLRPVNHKFSFIIMPQSPSIIIFFRYGTTIVSSSPFHFHLVSLCVCPPFIDVLKTSFLILLQWYFSWRILNTKTYAYIVLKYICLTILLTKMSYLSIFRNLSLFTLSSLFL